jgi:bifunctional enzyme Fae/Hps
MLDRKKRYLQIAFNKDIAMVDLVLPRIPRHEKILIEAGTPFIKREGAKGIRHIVERWGGKVVADLKTMDGAVEEVEEAHDAGASAATVLGAAPKETIDLFIETCKELGLISMIDMIGVGDPLKILLKLRFPPDVVVLHRGRDEEGVRGKIIPYKHINRIRSKFDVLISAAGGVDLREARTAIFNGANIVVVNLVAPEDPWVGIRITEKVEELAIQFLKTIE